MSCPAAALRGSSSQAVAAAGLDTSGEAAWVRAAGKARTGLAPRQKPLLVQAAGLAHRRGSSGPGAYLRRNCGQGSDRVHPTGEPTPRIPLLS